MWRLDLSIPSSRSLSIRMLLILFLLACVFVSDLLEDESLWPEKCLQDLSRKLGLQSSGTREELVTRLRLWHISRHEGQAFQGSNFYLLPVKENTVLPQFLSPYKPISDSERRSILRKRAARNSGDLGIFSTPPQSPTSPMRRSTGPRNKIRRSSEEGEEGSEASHKEERVKRCRLTVR